MTRSGLSEEDYLDWLENTGRPHRQTRDTDALLFAACVGLASAVVAGLWIVGAK